MNINTDFSYWAMERHSNTNHYYDTDLPYAHHLRMVVAEVVNFKDIIPLIDFSLQSKLPCTREEILINAAWGHDLIEDTRVSYNEVAVKAGYNVANIIYALTNEKGKSRSERANDKYYKGIRETVGASFIKMCDRIANVKHGVMTGSRMVVMYRKENEKFIDSIYSPHLEPMKLCLDGLFKLTFN